MHIDSFMSQNAYDVAMYEVHRVYKSEKLPSSLRYSLHSIHKIRNAKETEQEKKPQLKYAEPAYILHIFYAL